MYPRKITHRLLEALGDTPVVCLLGARQTGKTTLVRELGRYVTFDEAGPLAAAADPLSFLSELAPEDGEPLVLDEVQFAPQLFPPLKLKVDRDRRPGQFLLTGSANVLLLPKLSESLAGRIEVLTLWPLAQAEIERAEGNLVDDLFAEAFPRRRLGQPSGEDRRGVLRRVLAGGYPEPLARPAGRRRRAWFESYLTTLLQRDVREMARIEGLTQMPRLLALLAARCATTLNVSDLSREAGLTYSTLQRYLALLQAAYLVRLLPPWATSRGSRVVKTPKVLLTDTGLAASLLRADEEALLGQGTLLGQLFECFAALELLKLASWSDARPDLYHWRTHARQEVDLVLEGPGGAVVGVEVKAAATVTGDDFRHLRALSEVAGGSFRRGVVLYTGERALPFGPSMVALPISALWS